MTAVSQQSVCDKKVVGVEERKHSSVSIDSVMFDRRHDDVYSKCYDFRHVMT